MLPVRDLRAGWPATNCDQGLSRPLPRAIYIHPELCAVEPWVFGYEATPSRLQGAHPHIDGLNKIAPVSTSVIISRPLIRAKRDEALVETLNQVLFVMD